MAYATESVGKSQSIVRRTILFVGFGLFMRFIGNKQNME